MIARCRAKPGSRDSLLEALLADVGAMPGCLSYVVAKDAADPDVVWFTEVWDRQESHQASLVIPEVRAAIDRCMALIESFDPPTITEPVGGVGLTPP
jgi:quinol monooxygenase YgiN